MRRLIYLMSHMDLFTDDGNWLLTLTAAFSVGVTVGIALCWYIVVSLSYIWQ